MNKLEDSKSRCNGTNGYHEPVLGENEMTDETTSALLAEAEGGTSTVINSNYCVWTILITTASTMMSIGLAMGALNPTLIIMKTFYNQTYFERYGTNMTDGTSHLLIGLTVSMIFAGGFLGALSLGIFMKFFTRKQSMIAINLINIAAVALGSVAGFAIPSYEAVIIGRFFMGFVSGIAMNLVPMITSETSTKKKSAFYLSLIGVNLSFGGLVGLLLGYKQVMGNYNLWPILLAVPALPSLVYVIMSPWLPETPSYLLLMGNKNEALKTLSLLRSNSDVSLLQQELADVQREQEVKDNSELSVSLKTMFQKHGYRWQLFLVVMVFVESQFCGVNGIGTYTDTIFREAGIDSNYVTFASTIVYSVQLFVAILGTTAVDKWGPRRLSIFWSGMMTLALVLLTVSMAIRKFTPVMAYISVAAVTVYIFSWACGPNITLFPLIAALTTEPTRETTFKFGGGIFWIASWFNSFITPYILANLKAYAFMPWALCNLFFTLFYYFQIPETFGKTSQEIQAQIHSKGMRRKLTETALELLEKSDNQA